MRITFHKVEIHNFMSFADEVFDFDAYDGMSLITGKNFDIPNSANGSGKSTIFQALLFGLYGQLPTKIKAEHIANRYVSDKDVRVVVYVDVDTDKYKASSGLTKRGSGYFQLEKLDACDITWKDITKSSIAETRDFFESQVLHCDISLFLRTILLTSEQNYNFFNLKKQDKREFIEKLFDISVFGEMFDKIHRDSLDLDKKMISHQNQLIVLNRNEDDYKARIEQFDQQKASKEGQLKKQIEEVEKQLQLVESTEVKKNTDLLAKYEEAKDKLSSAKQKVNESLVKSNLEAQAIKNDITKSQSDKKRKEEALAKHAELIKKLCDDCREVFLKYHNLTTYEDEIKSSEKDIKEKSAQLKKKVDLCNQLKAKAIDVQSKLEKALSKIKDINDEYDKAKSQHTKVSNQLSALKQSLKDLVEKINPYTALVESTREEIAKEQSTLDEIGLKSKYLKKAEQIVSQDSLKQFIIKDLIGLINNRIRSYLAKMGAKYTCVFDEDLDYEFITESGTCELSNFSCGEKKRLEIATCLSFRDFISQRSNIQSNILVLDEYIDSGIDSLAVDSVLSILKSFTTESKQSIFIISHRSEINNEAFDRMIEVQKKAGISTIHLNEQQA